ncbi:MAG: DUF5947 family protein [Rhodococcus sp. (in: high G+C Gram-positive bacteria)]|uniref:DUF5947 family protein n=1 Tax=Rhodococcus sp. TaxID=1831 RepID=UPI003BAF69DA
MGSPRGGLRVLRRIASERPEPVAGERCDMCAAPIADAHQHVVNVRERQLMCVCRGCYLLFTDGSAELRFRAVPDRYLSFPDFELAPGRWDELEVPVGLAFVFRNSLLGKTVAFYPGPAGATESELPLDAWADVLAANPELGCLAADTEALILRVPGRGSESPECFLVPIDACYQLVGELRRVWRGFDGGQDARRVVDTFFDTVRARSRPVVGSS